jgi:thymidylate synthase
MSSFSEIDEKEYQIHRQQIQEAIEVGLSEEFQYLELIKEIIETGIKRDDRTGVGTLAVFGRQMRFSLRDGTLPLLTTKFTSFRLIAEELLWFIRGSTNAKELAERNVHIWDLNTSREFLDARGLYYLEEGDIGAGYPFQWRHFGAKYEGMHKDYTGQGFDQLADVIHKIKTNPYDRRIIMSAWNPADLHLMALPPCHMFCQFFVDTEKKELSCLMYQRSCDMGLGVPFNIASYSLLTHMIAHVCGLKAGEFIHSMGDTHVYLSHVEPLKQLFGRMPYPFPTIQFNGEINSIDDFSMEHIELVGYKFHSKIAMEMAV